MPCSEFPSVELWAGGILIFIISVAYQNPSKSIAITKSKLFAVFLFLFAFLIIIFPAYSGAEASLS